MNAMMMNERAKRLAMKQAGQKVDELVVQYQVSHPDVSYSQALRLVLDANPGLKSAYVGVK
ncbi:MAG: hypothetical protein ACREVH_01545 [Gammaproteobacteria bacterium]